MLYQANLSIHHGEAVTCVWRLEMADCHKVRLDAGLPAHTGVDQVDSNLGILDPLSSARVLTLHADRAGALLDVARPAEHQHRPLVVQVLHAVGSGLPCPLGDRPAVLARQVRQQPEHQPAGPPAGFDPCESASDPPHGHLERLPPTAGIYVVTCGHRLLVSAHNSR